MRRYLLWLEYFGGSVHGFQKQPGLPTVQGALEHAFMTLLGDEVKVSGAGRTDAGVHARRQAAAATLLREVDIQTFKRSLNAVLPEGISVIEMVPVPEGFDPRRDAEWREYRYFILNRSAPSPILKEYSFFFPSPLDWGLIARACEMVQGERDFSAFTVGARIRSSTRRVISCRVEKMADWPGLHAVVVRADSFLYKMVRILCGALLRVGSGKMTIGELSKHLLGGVEPCAEPLPPNGLFLWEVSYPRDKLTV